VDEGRRRETGEEISARGNGEGKGKEKGKGGSKGRVKVFMPPPPIRLRELLRCVRKCEEEGEE
jgi:hypothetical protein